MWEHTFIPMFIINLVILILFSWSMYSSAKLVDHDKQLFPDWFCWMMLIPFVGYVFAWLMLPFGIPRSFTNATADNEHTTRETKKIFGLGLTYLIIAFFAILHTHLGFLLNLVSYIFLILYWLEVVNFKKKYLIKK